MVSKGVLGIGIYPAGGGGSWEDYARGLMDQPCYPKLSQMTPIQVHKEKGWEAEFLSGLPSLYVTSLLGSHLLGHSDIPE